MPLHPKPFFKSFKVHRFSHQSSFQAVHSTNLKLDHRSLLKRCSFIFAQRASTDVFSKSLFVWGFCHRPVISSFWNQENEHPVFRIKSPLFTNEFSLELRLFPTRACGREGGKGEQSNNQPDDPGVSNTSVFQDQEECLARITCKKRAQHLF